MRDCPDCGGPVEATFHYCPWCSAPQRRKLVEFFRPHEELESDRGKALRVSRYFGSTEPERYLGAAVSSTLFEAPRLRYSTESLNVVTPDLPVDSTR